MKTFKAVRLNDSEVGLVENIKKYYEAVCKREKLPVLPISFGSVGKAGAMTEFNPVTKAPIRVKFDLKKVKDIEWAILHEIVHVYFLINEKDPVFNCNKSAKFSKRMNMMTQKYLYSDISSLLYQ